MLAHRVIPTLLQRGSGLVKGVGFDSWRSVGHVRQAIRIHQQREVDELIYLDIAATPEGRGPDFALVESFADECFMPLTVGGGVRTIEDIRKLLEVGADKVAICTAAIEDPTLIPAAARRFGSQAIVLAIDVGHGACAAKYCGKYQTGIDIVKWAQAGQLHGAGEILLTSCTRDGTLQGYDLDLIAAVSQAVDIPVIANGGCGTYEHMAEAIRAGASAVAAGAMFQWTEATPKGAAKYLHEQGITARI